jgi:hypothetical protein
LLTPFDTTTIRALRGVHVSPVQYLPEAVIRLQ